MERANIIDQIALKQSFLCVGLDSDLKKIPKFFLDYEDPIFEFNQRIIALTKDYCVAYKPNIAFYEALGTRGWVSLERTLEIIPDTHFSIADAKRGDIGNTSSLYARTFFETYPFHAVTIAPYMGRDSVLPFLEFDKKWVILLGLTSNIGSQDFQFMKTERGQYFYQLVLETSSTWTNHDRMMYVVGATQPESFKLIRQIVPNHFLLVPGVGSQGGDLQAVFKNGSNRDVGLLVNASRSIIYASNEEANFDEAVEEAAFNLQQQMKQLMT
ncbi:MAG: orotidine-5'-phosphate decarboxylase [Saprospiraceae bacterium]|nr:orotidine-5'-phosphate decarboxylase [Saprospiraceae bacterium]